ncbi:MAG: hypothetical protein DRJ30_00065 [Candidatus Methanomethylicota archaeon]|nr:MAG: hypothetical protein DRJ30_00065 [Candidatus Verstraetearchaeota archaeon]
MPIKLKDAVKDFLKEHGITVNDILDLMDENKIEIAEAFKKRTWLKEREIKSLVERYSARKLNLLLFIIQTFYLANPSGLYKGFMLEPRFGDIVLNGKVTREGVVKILKEIEGRIIWR